MKKSLILLLTLGGLAMGAEDILWASPITTTLSTNDVPGWTLNTQDYANKQSAVDAYDFLNGTFNEGGILTLTMNLTYDSTQSVNYYQSLLHVGQDGTGFSVYVNGTSHLIVTEKHDTNARHETKNAGAILVNGDNTVVITLTGLMDDNGDPNGKASVSVSVNGGDAQSVDSLSWTTMGWNANDETQRTKYSFGCKAPGWGNDNKLGNHIAIVDNKMVMEYTARIPEPATATLSLLALAGLAAHRRRR